MIVVVVLELFACLVFALVFALGNDNIEQATLPMSIWLALATLQLAIHYLPRGRYVRYGLLLTVTMILIASFIPGKSATAPYFHQALLIAGIAALPQLWFERFSTSARDRWAVVIGLAALPFGIFAWSIGNIAILKAGAWAASNGAPYCLFTSAGSMFSSKYREASSYWDLRGGTLFAARGTGGSGSCCQWDFHALLLTHDNRLFNWSYVSQRFEVVSERTRKAMHLGTLKCP